MKNERECIVCKTHYEYCPNCSKYDRLPRWMFLFCSQNCHDIYSIENAYDSGAITKEKARERLDSLDLSKRDDFTQFFAEKTDEIEKAEVGQTTTDSETIQ